ncbi:MAG: helix-turn-helix domain-containing protein [Streptococcaceae bacterium]|jgi:predicted DNA-binding protein (UPF0251 family)|nr:helix-turn-helix domain-containing protein [Streptococcaceae bacterium]
MENLILSLQYDNQLNRQIALLKFINNYPQGVSTAIVVEHLQCTKKTLRDYIVYLNDELENYIHIRISAKGKVTYLLRESMSIDTIVSLLYQESLTYLIVNSLLHNEQLSVNNATMKFAVSRSTLMKAINHMKAELALYQLSIAINPIKLVGDEVNIRLFLFRFYTEIGNSALIREDSELLAKEYIEHLHQYEDNHLYLGTFRVAFWKSITQARRNRKCFVKLPKEYLDKMKLVSDFENFTDTYEAFYRKHWPVMSLPIDEIVWSYLILLDCVTYSDKYNETFIPAHYRYYRKASCQLVEKINRLLTQNMNDRLRGFLINTAILSSLSKEFELVAPGIRQFVKETHSELHQMWKFELEQSDLSFRYLDDIATNLAILQFSSLSKKQKFKIIFTFQGAKGFSDYLAEMSKILLLATIEPIYCLEYPVTDEVISQMNANLVICNYDLFLKNSAKVPVVRLSNIPLFNDWEMAREKIDQLLSKYNEIA